MWKYFWAQNIIVKITYFIRNLTCGPTKPFFFSQWTTSMKNRILCILFLHYQDFLHHSVKIGSDVFIYKTPHTSIPCLKIKPPLSNPHCIANLMHTINNTNKLQMRKFSVWLHNCQQLYPMNTICEDWSVLWCASVTEQAVPDVSKVLLTKLQCYIPQDFNLWQHCCDLQSHTTQSTFIILFTDIKQVLSIH